VRAHASARVSSFVAHPSSGELTRAEARVLAAEALAADETRARVVAEALAAGKKRARAAAEARALTAEARAADEAKARAVAEAEVERLHRYFKLDPPRAKQT